MTTPEISEAIPPIFAKFIAEAWRRAERLERGGQPVSASRQAFRPQLPENAALGLASSSSFDDHMSARVFDAKKLLRL
jgi:hypothetical protein